MMDLFEVGADITTEQPYVQFRIDGTADSMSIELYEELRDACFRITSKHGLHLAEGRTLVKVD